MSFKIAKLSYLSAALLGIVSFSSNNANALELEQISARAGSLGLGAEIGFEVVPTFIIRGVTQKYDYDYNESIDGIQYEGTLGLGSSGIQVDFHPPLIPLYLTAGIYANDNNISMLATPQGTYNIGGNTYTGAQIGNLNSDITFDKTALYGGLGLEFQIGPVGLVAEGGVYYQGDPKVKMTASGPIASNPTFLNDLNSEVAKVTDELDSAKYWPALTVMGRWKF